MHVRKELARLIPPGNNPDVVQIAMASVHSACWRFAVVSRSFQVSRVFHVFHREEVPVKGESCNAACSLQPCDCGQAVCGRRQSKGRHPGVTLMNILLVDDDPSLRKSLRLTLETLGHAVTEAENG